MTYKPNGANGSNGANGDSETNGSDEHCGRNYGETGMKNNMTIREAHVEWGKEKNHAVFYLRTRGLFEKAFGGILDHLACMVSGQDLQKVLTTSSLCYEDKVKVASVMEHVMKYAQAHEPNNGYNINWSYNDLLKFNSGCWEPDSFTPGTGDEVPTSEIPGADATGTAAGEAALSLASEGTEVKPDGGAVTVPQHTGTVKAAPAAPGCEEPDGDAPDAVAETGEAIGNTEIKKCGNTKIRNTEMETNGMGIAQAVLQLDPDSGAIINQFVSVSAAERAIGIKNIGRAIKNHGTAGGFRWKKVSGDSSPSADAAGTTAGAGNKVPTAKPSAALPKGAAPAEPGCERKAKFTYLEKGGLLPVKVDLSIYSDQELLEEIRRRKWEGNVKFITSVEL